MCSIFFYNYLFIEHQHGFTIKKATDRILSHMDDGYQPDVVYSDFSKVFDKISSLKFIFNVYHNRILINSNK